MEIFAVEDAIIASKTRACAAGVDETLRLPRARALGVVRGRAEVENARRGEARQAQDFVADFLLTHRVGALFAGGNRKIGRP